jgi:hypothetical protein
MGRWNVLARGRSFNTGDFTKAFFDANSAGIRTAAGFGLHLAGNTSNGTRVYFQAGLRDLLSAIDTGTRSDLTRTAGRIMTQTKTTVTHQSVRLIKQSIFLGVVDFIHERSFMTDL